MATHRQRFIVHLVRGAVLSAALMGCGGQPGAVDSGTESTETDVTPPRLLSKFPEDEQSSVPTNTHIALTFSEPLNATRAFLYEPYIIIKQAIKGSLVEVQKRSTWVADSNTFDVVPSTFLQPNTQYTVEVKDGLIDNSTSPNHLDTGTVEHSIIWRFTTGCCFDGLKPEWYGGKFVRAVAENYDTVTVCWWNNEPAQSIVGCGDKNTDYQDLNALPPAAFDQPNLDSNGLVYTVQYKRRVDAGFIPMKSEPGEHRVTLTGLTASTEYHIRVMVSDIVGNQADVILEATPVVMPSAGRLYVANQVANALSVMSDAGQAAGNKSATVVTANETRLVAPTGIAVDRLENDPTLVDPDGYVYVAEAAMNRIMAYKLRSTVGSEVVEFGQYSVGHNMAPAWTIEGTLTSTDLTELCGPGTLRLERRDGRKILYVVNSLALPVGASRPACIPDKIVAFDVTRPPQGTNQPPAYRVERPGSFFSPIGLDVNETDELLFVANRDDLYGVGGNAGSTIDVYSYNDLNPQTIDSLGTTLDQLPHRTFWAGTASSCTAPASEPAGRICGPTALAYDADYDRLYVVNRGKSNILIFQDVSSQTTAGVQTPVVVQGADTGIDDARPVGIFLDPTTRRVYVTTDSGQSVLIFDADELAVGGNVLPRRVIKGTKTLLGQPAKDPNAQSRGPYAVTVVNNAGVNEAYVVTPGLFGTAGLAPVPTVTVFNVTGGDPSPSPTHHFSDRITNTPPDRVLVDPLLGASAVALDPDAQRLYVASFHANMIAVYDDPLAFASGQQSPDRIIAGPSTRLDHPVALLFRPATLDHPKSSLYVVNQSSHAVAVFEEGEGTLVSPLLGGNKAPTRYLGPPDGTDPFSTTANLTQMVFPTGLAIDPDQDVLYVSNRDAEEFQDLVGRRIVAFQAASTIDENEAPTWKIEGDRPPSASQIGFTNTDKTTLKRPAGLWLIPDPDPGDAEADDRLVVANRDGISVLVFRGVHALVAAAAAGSPPEDNLAPTWTIKDPLMPAPFGLAFEGIGHTLYVSDLIGRILAFDLDDLVSGTAAPDLTPRFIQGVSTGLAAPLGLALDPLN